MDPVSHAVLTPCIGLCCLDAGGYCVGCLRSGEEIARWRDMSDAERRRYMFDVLPARGWSPSPAQRLAECAQLQCALHPLQRPPLGPGWNQHELQNLLPAESSVEAAVLVGLVPRADGTRVLLTRRTDSLRHHGGQVSFPGGRIDPGDADAVAAAIRESHEEIALAASQVEPLGYLDPFLTISGFRVMPVVAAIDPAFVPQPHPDEVAEVFEVPLVYLMAPENLRGIEIDDRGQSRVVLEYVWPEQRIWGATAAILLNLRRRLEQTA
ncbi:CoA pyrophosphatase [Xanthomonas albilineans]|uniref:Putative nudix hydrolase family transmembrane protein n=1 Tax=Xanthomonas albilineans (strain GPE PC73 / CFBP 7063) TaxID=380358 RepID=D2U8T7_XANAP|nr:CoA pyrophosphatase [Xanthomonas albilineans]QHQ28704.1 putative nudix hydrolase family transmembrane protein [Xanthomonas albilineans]CBA16469.1 putative nudix hydrolase family transmembrane protein [Xanthomonas albilineans GPE PC73]